MKSFSAFSESIFRWKLLRASVKRQFTFRMRDRHKMLRHKLSFTDFLIVRWLEAKEVVASAGFSCCEFVKSENDRVERRLKALSSSSSDELSWQFILASLFWFSILLFAWETFFDSLAAFVS